MTSEQVQGLRIGGMTGVDQEVEGMLVREGKIKEKEENQKDEKGKQSTSGRKHCHKEREDRKTRKITEEM